MCAGAQTQVDKRQLSTTGSGDIYNPEQLFTESHCYARYKWNCSNLGVACMNW